MKLRSYQKEAVAAAKSFVGRCYEPCLLELATGAGKSLICSEIAKWLANKSQKKILCLAPTKELTEQNYEKYTKGYGEKASYYCASISKSLRHSVIFGTPQSVSNSVKRFSKGDFCAVVIDEAHGITPTIKKIISEMKVANPNLRIIGMTATPYRLNEGYIYTYDPNNVAIDLSTRQEKTFFHTLVYRITSNELIEMGYLTPPLLDHKHFESYDTSQIKSHTQKEYEQTFEGQGRKTSKIITDVVEHSVYRKGVMIFAATVKHAKECLESLPEGSQIITDSTKKKDREEIISDFKKGKFKYIVNVSVLTTGFDAPHVDVIAILRATKSAALFQQIIGRGSRLSPRKKNYIVLDYANNIESHKLQDDLFAPEIKARKKKSGSVLLDINCPLCGITNKFSARENKEGYEISDDGYFLDLAGYPLKNDDGIQIPAHYGRRCLGYVLQEGRSVRCNQKWSTKACYECGHENDIAARYCEKCKAEIIDPNEKLVLEFTRMQKDVNAVSTLKVLSASYMPWVSVKGNKTIKVSYVTDYHKFFAWYSLKNKKIFHDFSLATIGILARDVDHYIEIADTKFVEPKTITYNKKKGSHFFKVYAHNHPEDIL